MTTLFFPEHLENIYLPWMIRDSAILTSMLKKDDKKITYTFISEASYDLSQ